LQGESRFDTLLAVREALSNAMTHANATDPARVHLSAGRAWGGRIQIIVLDEGLGFDLETHEPPDTQQSERGRGIPLIRHFSHQVTMVGGELTMIFG
jgi:anti-sigma regulatory factor (Ser/Thr protein kinase)